jgi:hypothetical protein
MVVGVSLALTIVAATSSIAQAGRWGVDQYSTNSKTMHALETKMGHPFGSWSVYAGIGEAKGYSNHAGPALRQGKMVYLNITSNALKNGHKVAICWPSIAGGNHDSQLAAWARAIRSVGHMSEVIITFEHEPLAKNPSQPKCRSDTGSSYKAAFHHMERYLRNHGVTSRWSFIPTLGNLSGSLSELAKYVPWGDFTVVGCDIYNRASAWKTIADKTLPFRDWRASHAATRTMPVILPELGVDSRHSGAAQWITDIATRLRSLYGSKLLMMNWNVKYPYGPHTISTTTAWLAAAP